MNLQSNGWVCSGTFMNAEQVPVAGGDRNVHVKHVWSLREELWRPTNSRANYTLSPLLQSPRQKRLTGSECRNHPGQDLSVSKLTLLSVSRCVKATMCRGVCVLVCSPGLSSEWFGPSPCCRRRSASPCRPPRPIAPGWCSWQGGSPFSLWSSPGGAEDLKTRRRHDVNANISPSGGSEKKKNPGEWVK